MTGHTHSLADWTAFLSLGTSVHAALSVPYFLTVDADLADFDPRPAVRRALESGRYDQLLIAAGPALHTARLTAEQARDRALLAAVRAVLALLLRFNTPKGVAR